MAIWFPAFPIYKSVPFWEFGQCKLPPVDITEDQKIHLSNVCIRECFIVSYNFLKKENSELKLVFFFGTAAFLKSLFTTSFSVFFLLLCGCLSELFLWCSECVAWVLNNDVGSFISLSSSHFHHIDGKCVFLGAFTGVTGWNLISF